MVWLQDLTLRPKYSKYHILFWRGQLKWLIIWIGIPHTLISLTECSKCYVLFWRSWSGWWDWFGKTYRIQMTLLSSWGPNSKSDSFLVFGFLNYFGWHISNTATELNVVVDVSSARSSLTLGDHASLLPVLVQQHLALSHFFQFLGRGREEGRGHIGNYFPCPFLMNCLKLAIKALMTFPW